MASDPPTTFVPTPADGNEGAPLAGTRSQSMQRLQIGLFGLAAMVLLVALAGIIINNAERNQALVVPEAAPTMTSEANPSPGRDPLAEAGIVPDLQSQPEPLPPGQRSAGNGGNGSSAIP